jgi:hypothetical protein
MNRKMLPLERIWENKIVTEKGCWEWQGARTKGYGMVGHRRRANPGTRVKQVHRAAWELTYGPIPEGMFVLHRCDNPPCCKPEHLFLGTQKDNMQDCKLKGRNFDGRATLCPGAGVGVAPQDPVTGRFMKVKKP